MKQIGNNAFMSYRGCDYTAAHGFAQNLTAAGTFGTITIVPPERLCREREILLPYEYFELMEFITDSMANCDSFIVFDKGDYWASYWTQMEVRQWRRFSSDLVAHVASPDSRGVARITDTVQLEPLEHNEAKLLAGISVGTNRRMVRSAPMAVNAWGKFAKNCFLVPCVSCKEHFLATQKVVYSAIKEDIKVLCPHCTSLARFEEDTTSGNFYRKSVLIKGDLTNIRILDDSELVNLLIAKDAPPNIGLVALENEKIDSDLIKIIKAYGWAALGGVALYGASYLFDKLTKEET